MSIYEHSRFKVITPAQHLLAHNVSSFPYTNPGIPGVNNVSTALDQLFAAIYPKTLASVATPADLPTGIDTPNVGDVSPNLNEQRFVEDDGDGKAALYSFLKWDGDVAGEWKKIADMDWGTDSIVTGLQDQTQWMFPRKYGTTDYDPVLEIPLAGIDAGQHLYGGDAADQNLTLHANNGDDPGVHTGFVQVDDDFRPYSDLDYDLGDATHRWSNAWVGTLHAGTGTMSITGGSITDTSGAISFGDEDLSTTGNASASIVTGSTSLVVDTGAESLTITENSIVSSTGAISFGNENLTTTGSVTGASLVTGTLTISDGSIVDTDGEIDFGSTDIVTTGSISGGSVDYNSLTVDDIQIDGNSIDIITADTSLNLAAQGTGVIDMQSAMTTIGQTVTGIVSIIGSLVVDNITIDTDSITTSGDELIFGKDLEPIDDATRILGATGQRWKDIWLSGNIEDDTNSYVISELMTLRSSNYRDVARLTGSSDGDILVWNNAASQWLSAAAGSGVTHAGLGDLTTGDAGHTQFLLLAGRVGGQTGYGGTLTTQILALRSNSVDATGINIEQSSIRPTGDGAYDLGEAAHEFKDLYMSGQIIGGRAENTTTAGLAALYDAADVGRLAFTTDGKLLYVNDGSSFKKIGHNTHNGTYTNVELQSAIDVSADISDARDAIWQLSNAAEEILAVTISRTQTEVTVSVGIALPAGNYRLLGIQL